MGVFDLETYDSETAKDVTPREIKPPDYDVNLLATAFPDLIEMKFKQEKQSREIVVTLFNRGGKRQEITIGDVLPPDTESLVLKVQDTTTQVNSAEVEETAELFKGLDV